ncbi:hypothetical protein HY493_03030 [Candidatus Woesearchaeota archaeon]|nr:hypothetical protein [Candidatus Woesearchaeota archaeon]
MKKDRHPEYFEGILQLRNVSQEVYDWVYDVIERENKSTVAKEKLVTNGYDLYLTDQHYLQALGKRLKLRFAGEYEVSRRLYSQDRMSGKLLYRVTVLFRQLPFKVGDIIKTDEGSWKVLHVGNQIRAQDVDSGKKKMFKLHELDRFIR